MARLNDPFESDDELPELSALLGPQKHTTITTPVKDPRQEHINLLSSRRRDHTNLADEFSLTDAIAQGTITKASLDKPQSRKHLPLGYLKQSSINSLLYALADKSISGSRREERESVETVARIPVRGSPRRSAKVDADYSKHAESSTKASIVVYDDETSSTDLSGFIVPDSASDEEAISRPPKKMARSAIDKRDTQGLDVPVSVLSEKKNALQTCLESPLNAEPCKAVLVEANPDLDECSELSQHELNDKYYPLTPPLSPSKPKLKSPSKRHRIPPSPHRPSIDAFWSQDVINDWNEQYSPRRVLQSPRKYQLHSLDEDEEVSNCESPRKGSSIKCPAKKDRKLTEQRKLFEDKKHDLAVAFLAEVDQTINKGQITSMAQSTGGIQIIWSKKLCSTAGRANWRREAIRLKDEDGLVSNITHRHHASIELAEKVIDDEDRLLNVIAHEYCHLANFMISGIKDNPHGKEFKEWARRCTNAFSRRAVNVTTKHTFAIAYKYIWTCVSPTCGLEYKRHSKSIDTSKHSCGNCKGKLVQVQPAPRKRAGDSKRSEYQDFVKRENERVRLENPGANFGEVMSILGKEFKERKKHEAESASGVRKQGVLEDVDLNEPAFLDSVVRKFDFLNLES